MRNQAYGARVGRVSLSDRDGFGAVGAGERRELPVFTPRGMYSRPCEEDRVLLLSTGGGEACAGVLCRTRELAPGEVCLFSDGGAEIVLKNNGDISLNGVIITKSGEILKP